MIRVILVDDHTVVREALCLMLDQDKSMQVVAQASDGETALRLAADCLPDVVVMDVSMSGLSGIETTQRLHALQPQIRVIALSSHINWGSVRKMLDAGATGYIAKSAAGVELRQGIHAVAEGRRYFCAQAAALVTDSPRVGRSPSGELLLSRRERQVATLLAEGKSAPAIAAELHISAGTVDVHRRNLMQKLDLHNVVELTRYAIRTGLVLP